MLKISAWSVPDLYSTVYTHTVCSFENIPPYISENIENYEKFPKTPTIKGTTFDVKIGSST